MGRADEREAKVDSGRKERVERKRVRPGGAGGEMKGELCRRRERPQGSSGIF